MTSILTIIRLLGILAAVTSAASSGRAASPGWTQTPSSPAGSARALVPARAAAPASPTAAPSASKTTAPPAASAPSGTTPSNETLREQVRRAEAAFAKTMADRDHAAFVALLADEAIFVSPRRTLRGKQAIADGWKRLYEGKDAPFSWAPDKVEVLESGTLALSQGPVMDPSGKRVGTFNSTWRRERDGQWKIVLDNGCPDCECPPAGAAQGK